eukprot:CAMPEP_0197287472 /NCGR_PEP_ID=MMETSP0890-20130614/3852_1 /TAXON_ID=44058 ORGANISM="Aureoumbra lagunensis, Strain CCMP1510" /NCGR_SAMPLE_ID=MMETSP0890 /ASSEMBLY_ACC=CAM_ASM_000533 /LENGTH=358 /DNA_ID=CAMNT_0042757147 /DNA_START=195 /DNA_END=1271 /DNA_ORIENTATION=+
MTKVATAVAILQLRDAGKLSLDTQIASILEEWPEEQVFMHQGQIKIATTKITIRHLLQHSAGLSYGFWMDPVAEKYRERNLNLPHPIAYPSLDDPTQRCPPPSSLHDFCKKLAPLPLLANPGERYHYSVSFDVLGRIIECVSGLSLDEYFRIHIFDKVHANATHFYLQNPDTVAPVYVKTNQGFLVAPHIDPPPNTPPAAPSGGGGLYTTIADWCAFANGLLDGTLLSQNSIDELRTPDSSNFIRPPDSLAARYPALGLGVWCIPPLDSAHKEDEDEKKKEQKIHENENNYCLDVPIAPIMAPGAFGWPGASGSSFFVDPARKAAVVFTTHLFLADLVVPGLQASIFEQACSIIGCSS